MAGDLTPPLVSVVIPTYNRERLVVEAVESVLAQDFRDFEVIVVDDGSQDATQRVLEERYGGRDARVRVIRQENKGLPGARNAGIRAAAGELVALLDSDDLYCAGFLRESADFLRDRQDLALVFADTEKFNSTGVTMPSFFKGKRIEGIPVERLEGGRRIFRSSIVADLVWGNFIPCSAVMVRARCFAEAGLFNETFRFCEDVEMWTRLASRYTLGYLDKVLARVRVHDDNMTGERWSDTYYKYRMLVTEHLAEVYKDGPRELTEAIRQVLAGLHFSVGWRHFSQDRLADARRSFSRSLGYGGFKLKTAGYMAASCMPVPIVQGLRRAKNSRGADRATGRV